MNISKKISLVVTTLLIALSINAQSLSYAKRLIKNGEYKLAAEQLRPLTESGDAEACYLAAQLFVEGKGVMKSHDQAEKYYLKAVEKDYEQAAVELVALYESNNQKEKAIPIVTELWEKDYDKYHKTMIGYKYGEYLYHGYGGMEKDMSRGWSIMYHSGQNQEKLEGMKDEFYAAYIREELDDPITFWFRLFYAFWSYDSSPIKKWTANYLDDIVKAVKSFPLENQITHLKECEKHYEEDKTNEAIAVVLSMMYAEGIGTEMNYSKAKEILSSNIDDEEYGLFLDNLFKNYKDGLEGHMKSADFPDFWKVVIADNQERSKRWEYERKKKLVKTNCTATCFKVKSVEAWKTEDGNLRIRFEVFNTSPNPSGRQTVASKAFIKYNGKYHNVKLSYHIPDISTVGIKGHATTLFSVIVPAYLLNNSNELELVQFSLKSDWGEGIIQAQNVVWL